VRFPTHVRDLKGRRESRCEEKDERTSIYVSDVLSLID